MRTRSIVFACLVLTFAFAAAAQVDIGAIATDVTVGRFDPLQTPLAVGNGAIGLTLEPFEAIAVTWRSDPRIGTDPVVRVRASADGNAWSDWRTLAIDGDVTRRDEGKYSTPIAHFGATNQYLQLTIDRPADSVTVTRFPVMPPRPHRVATESVKFGSLDIRSRVDWGCPDGEKTTHGTPSYTTVTHAVLHHTAGTNNVPDSWDAEVLRDWYLHVFTNGWADIGYNFLIDPNGVIYEGRAGGDGVLGAHFSCINGNTVGIALLGTYSTVDPTPAAIASLKALLYEICAKFKIDAAAVAFHPSSGSTIPTIVGHRDGNSLPKSCTVTECPGERFYVMIPAIRTGVACMPLFELQPNSMTIGPGGSATLTFEAKGSDLTYQWYVGASGDTNAPLNGATSRSVTVSPSELTRYWVRITNGCGSVDSAAAIVNVSAAGKLRSARH